MSQSFLVLVLIAVVLGALLGLWWRSSTREQSSEPSTALSPEEGQKRLAELIGSGQTINAIKLHRQLYGSGLKEAKDAVEAMRDGRAPVGPPQRREWTDPGVNASIERAIGDKNLIEAIKLHRHHYGTGLKEAKDAVEAIRDGRAPVGSSGRKPLPDQEASAAIEHAIRDNDLIHAIKLYRELHGGGLKEAKDAVEAMRTDLLRRG
jgi:ribosomal protein L7/L12